MRILHVIPSLAIGGAEKITAQICSGLSRNHEVKLVLLQNTNKFTNITKNVDIVHCPSSVIPSVSGQWKIDLAAWDHIIDRFKPQIIHSHLFEAEILSRTHLRNNIHYVSHIHSPIPQFRNLKWRNLLNKQNLTDFYEKCFLKNRYKQCRNHFITVSEHSRSYLKRKLDLGDNSITMLHNAISLEEFNEKNHKVTFPLSPLKLICIGSLSEKKNHRFLLKVLLQLKKQGYDTELTIVGDGHRREALLEIARKLRITRHFHLPGFSHHVAEYLHNNHIYVHAATREGFGISHIEAMACGLPVVALNAGGNAELVKNDENGYLIDTQDVRAFSDAVLRIYNSERLYNKLSANAIAFAQQFDIGNYCSNLVNVYGQLLAK